MKDDTVSRASVLKAIDEYERLSAVSQTVRNMTNLREVVQGLPAAQTCDDAVSRQAAIKTLEKGLPSEPLKSKYTEGITVGFGLAITWIEQLPAVQPQPEEDCDTCKHGFFGSRQCDNCRMRYPSHYESIAVPSVQPEPEWNNHTVACLLAELFGDTCACNYNGIDEWLPEKCEVIDACPNPVGVACWEQFLKHRAERIQP